MNYHSTKRLAYGGADLNKLMTSLLEQRGLKCSDPQRLKELCARASSLPSSSEVLCHCCYCPCANIASEQITYDIALVTGIADHAADVAAMLSLYRMFADLWSQNRTLYHSCSQLSLMRPYHFQQLYTCLLLHQQKLSCHALLNSQMQLHCIALLIMAGKNEDFAILVMCLCRMQQQVRCIRCLMGKASPLKAKGSSWHKPYSTHLGWAKICPTCLLQLSPRSCSIQMDPHARY